ncbi:MAG: uroporphyrinogen-III C-methyltransferase [Candidatus Dadabacteria bacterium]|nr:MAG: uroporphyrinogen-III C-methyltransferase [Candidatus Dadabacteria bacterium]
MTGLVTFVGAGPGRLDWVTQAGRMAIERADTILVDALVSPALLSWARWEAEVIDVGKRGGQPSMPQEQICALLVEYARQGRRVVRLKGGDPGTFGRLPEEIASLRAHNLKWEVIPGISAAAAAAARAGISLTDRDHAASLTLLTGHRRLEGPRPELDWAAASRSGTGAVYMGILHARRNARRLLDQGVPPDTPVLIAEAVSTDRERLIRTTLAELPSAIERERVRPPAIWIYGEVARSAATDQPRLRGTVALFRPWGQHLEWHDALLAEGWQPVAIPLQRYEDPPDTGNITQVLSEPFDVIALASIEAARRLLGRLTAMGRDIRALAGTEIAVPGRATAAFLEQAGCRADIVLDAPTGMAALESTLRERPSGRLLIAGEHVEPPPWAIALEATGWDTRTVALYRKVPRPELPATWSLLFRRHERPVCIWSSSSQVQLISAWVGVLPNTVHVAIGQRTADALTAAGVADVAVAARPGLAGILEQLSAL